MFNFFTSTAGNIINAGINNMLNQNTYRQNSAFAFELGEKAADNAQQRAKEMADYTNAMNIENYERYQTPAAQLRQLKEAGLNPALLTGGQFGSSVGQAHASGAQGNGGASAPNGTTQMDIMGTMLQMELQKAQIEAIKADTKGKDLDNETKEKYGDATANATLQGIIASTNETRYKTIALKLQNEAQIFQNQMLEIDADNYLDIKEWQLESLKESVATQKQQTRALLWSNDFNDEQKQALVDEQNERVAALTEANIKARYQNRLDKETYESIKKMITEGANEQEIKTRLLEIEKEFQESPYNKALRQKMFENEARQKENETNVYEAEHGGQLYNYEHNNTKNGVVGFTNWFGQTVAGLLPLRLKLR